MNIKHLRRRVPHLLGVNLLQEKHARCLPFSNVLDEADVASGSLRRVNLSRVSISTSDDVEVRWDHGLFDVERV